MADQSIRQTTENDILMQQGVDSMAMLSTLITKLPILLILAVAGAILGSGLHLITTLLEAREPVYVSETEYYIAFAEGRYEAKDYYNDFTWNDVLATDLILGKAMELLGEGYDRDQVKDMISADILSDVRYLTITVRGGDPDVVESVKDALCTALAQFGQRMEEFDAIDKIEDLGITQENPRLFTLRAALLGAVLLASVGIFVILLRFCVGSSFYTKSDITKSLGIPVYGMTIRKIYKDNSCDDFTMRQNERLVENMRLLTERYPELLLMDASDGEEVRYFLQYIKACGINTDGMRPYHLQRSDREQFVLAVLPFGRPYREKITDEMNDAGLRGCKIVGAVLTGVDRNWAGIYFGKSKRK